MKVRNSVGGVIERVMRAVLLWLSRRRFIGRFAKWMPLSRPIVARFVAGETLDAALPALLRLRAAGFRTTVDILGEAVSSEAAARAAANGYVTAIPVLEAQGLEVNVSIKLSQMGLGLSPELVRENVARILTAASTAGGFVRIDMEDHTTTDATLAVWRELRPLDGGVG